MTGKDMQHEELLPCDTQQDMKVCKGREGKAEHETADPWGFCRF